MGALHMGRGLEHPPLPLGWGGAWAAGLRCSLTQAMAHDTGPLVLGKVFTFSHWFLFLFSN